VAVSEARPQERRESRPFNSGGGGGGYSGHNDRGSRY
jgi:hypothetical protein